jgi:hypothetical protein
MSQSQTPASFASALVRLAEEAKRRGLQLFLEEATGSWFCTSHRAPDRLYRVTAVSCSCEGFVRWQRCTHLALLHAEMGWLPDGDPQPPAPVRVVSSAPAGEDDPAAWLQPDRFAEATFGLVSPPAAITADPPQIDAPVTLPPIPITIKEDRAAVMQGTIDAAVERLARQLEAGYSAEFRQVLAFYSRFHQYSWANSMLIRIQCPEATLVAGLRRWADQGYQVRKGEKAIWIWAPIMKLVEDETGAKVERLVGFRPAPVFDASQLANLDDHPLPDLWTPLPDDVEALYRQVRDRIVRHGVEVEERRIAPGVQGASQGGRILISTGQDSRRRLLTLLHELCHEVAHVGTESRPATREQRELEAESVAYIVGLVLGIENPNSADYVLNWKGTAEQLRASLGTIQRLVKQVLAIVQPSTATSRVAA